MPGRSWRGPLPPLTSAQSSLAEELRTYVEHLAITIGPRNAFALAKYCEAEEYLGQQLQSFGYKVRRQVFTVQGGEKHPVECVNLDVELPGASHPEEIVVFGAHYDSIPIPGGCPAANDNGSGVAATLAVARKLAHERFPRTIRFVLFANEEPPYFYTEDMGSYRYAKACHERGEKIVGMLTPETIGYYSDEPGSQKYPIKTFGVFPARGNFIAFVGIAEFGAHVRRCVRAFRKHAKFPSIGVALPSIVSMVDASDHWGFGEFNFPALMVTDTAPFRYPHYHKKSDTPDKMDFEKMARVVEGLVGVVRDLASEVQP